MSKYILKRGEKRQAFTGTRVLNRNGVKVVEKIDVIFEPETVVDTDLDFDQWVGLALEKLENKSDAPKMEDPVRPLDITDREPEPEPEPAPAPSPEPDGEEADSEGYEKVKGGGYKCFTCGKVLKTEEGAKSHVEKH